MTANLVIATLLVAGSALSSGISPFNNGSAPQSQPQTQKPVRVFVQTDDTGVAEELAARQTSVKDLSESLASHKKLFVVVDDEDKSEIQIEVLGRGLTVPKVVLGIGPRPGESSIGSAPTKNAELRIRVTGDVERSRGGTQEQEQGERQSARMEERRRRSGRSTRQVGARESRGHRQGQFDH
jgi:hypothetical protein